MNTVKKRNLILGCTVVGTAGGVIAGLGHFSPVGDELMVAVVAVTVVVAFVWLPDALHDRKR